MNDEPRQKLSELIVEYGRSLSNDPNRCEALLKDYCGIYKREIFVLVSALRKKVPVDLLKSSAGVPQEIVIGRLCKQLEVELAMTAEAAQWAVESWALALGFITVSSPLVTSKPQPRPHLVVPNVVPAMLSPPHAAQVLTAGRYQDNHDGTVTDVTTGLQWMRFSLGQEWKKGACIGEAQTHTWQAALDAAKTLNLQGGYVGLRDWRVPTKEELKSIVYCSSGLPKTWNDTGKCCEGDYDKPTIYQQAFPNTPISHYWSSSPYPFNSNGACGVNFSDGGSYGYGFRSDALVVRLVRARQ